MNEASFKHTRFARIMTWEAYIILENATLKQRTIRYETPMSKFFTQTRPSRLLTACIQKYVRSVGAIANENVQGSLRKNHKGVWKFEYTGGKPGQEDISIMYNGKFMAIELKYGKDTMSESQLKYQDKMKQANTPYHIVKNFDQFIYIFNEFKK